MKKWKRLHLWTWYMSGCCSGWVNMPMDQRSIAWPPDTGDRKEGILPWQEVFGQKHATGLDGRLVLISQKQFSLFGEGGDKHYFASQRCWQYFHTLKRKEKEQGGTIISLLCCWGLQLKCSPIHMSRKLMSFSVFHATESNLLCL